MPKFSFLKQQWTTEQLKLFEDAINALEKCGISDGNL